MKKNCKKVTLNANLYCRIFNHLFIIQIKPNEK